MKLVKIKVCRYCLSEGISNVNCICVYQNNYPIIELEFEQCECCGNIKDMPANSEFNTQQFKKQDNG